MLGQRQILLMWCGQTRYLGLHGQRTAERKQQVRHSMHCLSSSEASSKTSLCCRDTPYGGNKRNSLVMADNLYCSVRGRRHAKYGIGRQNDTLTHSKQLRNRNITQYILVHEALQAYICTVPAQREHLESSPLHGPSAWRLPWQM